MDKNLNLKIKNDIRWRQMMMNILINYYFNDEIKESENIIQEGLQEIEDNKLIKIEWLDKHIKYKENNYITLNEIMTLYLN